MNLIFLTFQFYIRKDSAGDTQKSYITLDLNYMIHTF